ncbi:MAG: PAS domain-containing protein [Prolixibacteraceae bacterium]|nr:PAS domain-containing protein [Prolixibacteraceae bacterium]
MKLLSRFIWLIIGISALVFIGVTIFQIKTVKEFDLIKQSIRSEYDVQVDKMLTPDKYGIGIASYLSDICTDGSSSYFLENETPDTYFTENYLHDDILDYNQVDAVWFFTSNGDLFHFKTIRSLAVNDLPVPTGEMANTFPNREMNGFYAETEQGIVLFHSARVGTSDEEFNGYVVMASLMDQRWIDQYESTINNSVISIVPASEKLADVDDKTIRIIRDLKGYQQQSVATLNVELPLPFLSLWHRTNSADKWLMTGSMVIVLAFLIIFLLVWVISPLKKISTSLQHGDSEAIQPLVKVSTEMGDVARMIDDYHRKNEELEASESIKRHIIEQAQVGIIIAEENSGIIVTTNPYACELIKAPEDAVNGNVVSNFLAPVENLPAGNEGFESTLINSKGQDVTILRTSTHMMMDGRKVIMDTFVDLSEIKSLQDKLAEEKKKLSLAVQNSGMAFCEYDFKTDQISIDRDWDFLTFGENKHKGTNIISNIYESDRKKVSDQFEALKNAVKDTLATEFRVKHPERGLIWVSASILISKRDENHRPKQLIGLLEDISERIAVQQELIKAKEKAEESDRMKSSYLGNMSHKIRTPLNTIVGFANLLSEEELQAEEKENFINIIRKDTEQVLHLIDDMINLAKIDANQFDVNVKKCHVNKMVDNLARYYQAHDKTSTIKFEVKSMLPDGKDVLITDEDKLIQAINNLLNNAFKFTKSGNIELGYFINPVDNKLILYVKDTGIGIADEHKSKIFNRFYQIDPMSEGTGLGLTISTSLVKLLNGKLWFDSVPEKGSTFYIEMPFQNT